MNPTRLWQIVTSLPFLGLATVGLLAWLTVAFHLRTQAESLAAVPVVPPKRETQGLVKQLGTKALEFAVPPIAPAEPAKEIPPEIRRTFLAEPRALAFFDPAPVPGAVAEPGISRFLPYGTLIPCKLVNTVDSNADGTPIVGVVLEDMRNLDAEGVSRVVIPAGTMAYLAASQPGRERDRIAADGSWVFVWRTRDEDNGLELPVSGRALTREFNALTGLYGIGDGRAGLRGEVIEDPESRRVRAATDALIQGGLAAAKEYTVTSNALTSQVIRTPVPSLRNAALGAAEAYGQALADQVRESAQRDPSYVRVRAGTEFYIFPRETVDLRHAHRGATK